MPNTYPCIERPSAVVELDDLGLTVDGNRADLSQAVLRAQGRGRARVVVSLNAPASACSELMAALCKAGVIVDPLLRSEGGATALTRNTGPSGAMPFRAFDNVRTFDDLYLAQLRYLGAERGADQLDPLPGMTGGRRPIPRTTNADVVVLCDYWTQQLQRVKRVMGAAGVERRWATARGDVEAIARAGAPADVYVKNHQFWRLLQQTAIHVAAADEAPSKTDLMLEALKDSLLALPHRVMTGAQAVGGAVVDAASGAAEVVGGAAGSFGRGVLGPLGIPVLVGGGALVALYFLARKGRGED